MHPPINSSTHPSIIYCASIHPSNHLSIIHSSIHQSIYLWSIYNQSIYPCILPSSIHPFMQPIPLFIHHFINPPMHKSIINPSIHASIYICILSSIYPSIQPPIFPSIHPSILYSPIQPSPIQNLSTHTCIHPSIFKTYLFLQSGSQRTAGAGPTISCQCEGRIKTRTSHQFIAGPQSDKQSLTVTFTTWVPSPPLHGCFRTVGGSQRTHTEQQAVANSKQKRENFFVKASEGGLSVTVLPRLLELHTT